MVSRSQMTTGGYILSPRLTLHGRLISVPQWRNGKITKVCIETAMLRAQRDIRDNDAVVAKIRRMTRI